MNSTHSPVTLHAPVDLPVTFPADFVWGVSTSAFQIEGAVNVDGRGPSIWDTFCRVPGAIADGSNGDIACDHYNRLESDLDLIASLGVNAYRFSVSWPRVQPDGTGAWNEAGLAFYERLIDGLNARGIKPFLTLNHWDLPQALQDRGGWAVRETMHHFVAYARFLNKRLGDRVFSIATHNEPWVMAVLGNDMGIFAPGIKSRAVAAQVTHHLLLSHGLALKALRADGCKAELGIVLNMSAVYPATDSAADAAKMVVEDGMQRWYLDPLFHARYPKEVYEHLGADMPKMEPTDLQDMAQPLDFLGINYYTRNMVSAGEPHDVKKSGLPLTDMDWEIYPQGLTDLLLWLHRNYQLPRMYITENGGAFKDTVVDGQVHDVERTTYIADHITAMGRAMQQGVPMAGYIVWSLMDNFEWASGYAKRFGIVRVDYDTQQRTLKDSAHWYRAFLQRGRETSGVHAATAKGV